MKRVSQAAAGGEHSLFLTDDGLLFACGKHDGGRLGLDGGHDYTVPTQVGVPSIALIGAGEYHSVVSTAHGSVLSFGVGAAGQLGHGTNVEDVLVPRKVDYFAKMGPVSCKSLSCGDGHTIVVLDGGAAHAFGINDSGSLGTMGPSAGGTIKQSERYGFAARGATRSLPSPVMIDERIAQAATGSRHSLFLTECGEVFCSGDNTLGQIGFGALQKSSKPRKLALDVKISSIGCGAEHSILLTVDGRVLGSGSNKSGELGIGKEHQSVATFRFIPLTGVQRIACGAAHSIFVVGSDVWTCGWGRCGALGVGSVSNVYEPQVTMKCSCPPKAVSAGSHHSIVLLEDGTVWTCGSNGHGQLGLGHTNDVFVWHQVLTWSTSSELRCCTPEVSLTVEEPYQPRLVPQSAQDGDAPQHGFGNGDIES